jgi:hypothetical protein
VKDEGAFSVCARCKFSPEGDDVAMAKSLMLSEGWRDEEGVAVRTVEELREIGRRIRAGEAVVFDEEALRKLVAQKRELDLGELPESRIAAALLVGLGVVFSPLLLVLALKWWGK